MLPSLDASTGEANSRGENVWKCDAKLTEEQLSQPWPNSFVDFALSQRLDQREVVVSHHFSKLATKAA